MKPIDLISQCKELHHKKPKVQGVYFIYCEANQHGYVGSAVDVYFRLGRHKSMLNLNKHFNPHMQSAWNKYGKAAFRFLLLDEFKGTYEERILLERMYFEQLDRDLCFNNQTPMMGREPGFKISEEHRKILSEVNKGHTRNKGRIKTPEEIEKRAAKLRGRPLSEAHRLALQTRLRAKPPRAKLTWEQVREMRRLHSEAKGNRPRVPHGFAKKLAAMFGVSDGAVDEICHHHQWKE